MIEVRPTGATTQVQPASASSQGAVKAQESNDTTLVKSEQELPKKEETSTKVDISEGVKPEAATINVAVSSINEYVQSVHRDIQFMVDSDLDETVVKVVDGDSGELIRQIPGEVFLELARKLKEDGELRLVDATG